MKIIFKAILSLTILGISSVQMNACSKEEAAQAEEKTSEKSGKTLPADNYACGKLSDELMTTACPGALALLSCCMYYEDRLQKGISLGQKWVYTNSSKYSPQSTSFDNMVASGKYGANCAMPANWAYIDMGIMKEGQRFWGDSEGGFKHYDDLKAQILKAASVTSWYGSKSFKVIFEAGKVKPGDVFLCKGHTFIYLGDKKFLAAGHDSKWHSDPNAETEDSRHAVFDTWVCDMESNSDYNYKIYWQISFKDSYTPEFYRNKSGKIVPYPAE